MDDHCNQWPYEGTTQPSSEEGLERLQLQISNALSFSENLECQSTQNAYCQIQADFEPISYHPNSQGYPNSWGYSQESSHDSNHASQFDYRSPSPYELTSQPNESFYETLTQEEENRLEALLADVIERNEVRMASEEAAVHSLENQLGQLVNAITNPPQGKLPVLIVIDDEAVENCTVDTQGKCIESRTVVEGDVIVQINQPTEAEVEDERSNSGGIVIADLQSETTLPTVEILEGPIAHKERFQFNEQGELVDNSSGERFYVPPDDWKDEENEDDQSSMSAKNPKELTNRRHEKVIFAYEPD